MLFTIIISILVFILAFIWILKIIQERKEIYNNSDTKSESFTSNQPKQSPIQPQKILNINQMIQNTQILVKILNIDLEINRVSFTLA